MATAPTIAIQALSGFPAMSNSTALDILALTPYLHGVGLRDQSVLADLRAETAAHPLARMQVAAEEGQLLAFLVRLTGARRIIEVGTFTGYSSLCMALALPQDGEILCCDVSDEYTTIARRYWERAGVSGRITLALAPALDTLEQLLRDGQAGQVDMMFIDADKEHYPDYVELGLRLLKPGGLMVVDNTLWSGKVADEQCQDADTRAIRAFNASLPGDERVDFVLLPMVDGITLVRKR
jgi:predicted O-methyltransferase YrrM